MRLALSILCITLSSSLLSSCTRVFKQHDFLILHMGSPALRLITARIKKLGGTYLVHSGTMTKREIDRLDPKAIIINGRRDSVLDEAPLFFDKSFYDLNRPVLGLCYGMQVMAVQMGGTVKRCAQPEKGTFPVTFTGRCGLTPPDMKKLDVIMDHDDCVTSTPDGFITDSVSEISPHAMSCHPTRHIYWIQFHPEHYDLIPESGVILDNFLIPAMRGQLLQGQPIVRDFVQREKGIGQR